MSDENSILRGKEWAEENGEPFYWTGNTRTSKCGCVWHELVRTDGTGEPIWMGGRKEEVCQRHHDRMVERVHQLQDEGKLPRAV